MIVCVDDGNVAVGSFHHDPDGFSEILIQTDSDRAVRHDRRHGCRRIEVLERSAIEDIALCKDAHDAIVFADHCRAMTLLVEGPVDLHQRRVRIDPVIRLQLQITNLRLSEDLFDGSRHQSER